MNEAGMMGGGMGGGGGLARGPMRGGLNGDFGPDGGDGDASQAVPAPSLSVAKNDSRNKKIFEKLAMAVPMNFQTETALSEVLVYIREATKQDDSDVLPIYVDPIGLQETDKSMSSTVILELEGIPLRITLKLMLKQLGLSYFVKDGILFIIPDKGDASEYLDPAGPFSDEFANDPVLPAPKRPEAAPGGGLQ